MKKILFSALILSLLLATLTACGAEAQQSTTPEPAPQVDQIEPEKPELPAEPAPEPTPEPLVDVEPVAEPEPVADVEPEPEPASENTLIFTDCNETVYATSQVNLRNGPGTNYDKLGSLSAGNSVHRVGIGTGDYSSWSRIELSDGTYAYVASSYLSTTKPVVQQQQAKTSGGGSTSAKPSGQSSGTSSGSTTSGGGKSGGTSGGSSEAEEGKRQAEARGQGAAGLIGSKPIDTTQEGYNPES